MFSSELWRGGFSNVVLCSLFLWYLQFLLNQRLQVKETNMKSWERNRLPVPKDFLDFRDFLSCINTNSRPSKRFCRKKIERGLFRNNREPEGRASCVGFGRCSLLWVMVQALEFDSPTFLTSCPRSRQSLTLQWVSLGLCWGILARSWETFPDESLISINTFSQSLLMSWHLAV